MLDWPQIIYNVANLPNIVLSALNLRRVLCAIALAYSVVGAVILQGNGGGNTPWNYQVIVSSFVAITQQSSGRRIKQQVKYWISVVQTEFQNGEAVGGIQLATQPLRMMYPTRLVVPVQCLCLRLKAVSDAVASGRVTDDLEPRIANNGGIPMVPIWKSGDDGAQNVNDWLQRKRLDLPLALARASFRPCMEAGCGCNGLKLTPPSTVNEHSHAAFPSNWAFWSKHNIQERVCTSQPDFNLPVGAGITRAEFNQLMTTG